MHIDQKRQLLVAVRTAQMISILKNNEKKIEFWLQVSLMDQRLVLSLHKDYPSL